MSEQDVDRQLQVPVGLSCLDEVQDFLASVWEQNPGVAELDKMLFEIAVVEIVGNIVEHGSTEGANTVELRVWVRPSELEGYVRDRGDEVTIDITAAAMPDEWSEHGRGVPMALAAVDRLVYERLGDLNCWRLTRHRKGN